MKRHFFLFILLFWFSAGYTFSQANAGSDTYFVVGEVGPVIGGAGGSGWCYSWEPADGLSDSHSPNPIATPSITTTYKLKVVGPDFSFTAEDEVTVFVIKELKLEVKNNITECMEKRQLTYTATLDGDLNTAEMDQVEYKFHYQKSNGSQFTHNEWSFNKTLANTITADSVQTGDIDHKYTTTVYAEAKIKDVVVLSDSIKIDVHELWIATIEYNSLKSWKAVVGEPFKYSAFASSDCVNWKWEMSNGTSSYWQPSGGDKQNGTMTIPYSDLPAAKNSYFGDTYGIITVSCEDAEGNKHTFKSTDMTNPLKVQVFFDPDKNTHGTEPYTLSPPCWFIFWKEGEVVEGMESVTYNHTLDYGAYDPASKVLSLGPLACTTNSGPEILKDMDGNFFTMTGTGKHLKCVAQTISHELYHKFVNDSLAILSPHSDTDKLPDFDELVPHLPYFKMSRIDDHNTFGYAPYSASGYADAEVRGRIIEISPGVKLTVPGFDWSKDPENPQW